MAAASREVAEETGVYAHDLRLVGLYYGSRDKLLRITFASAVSTKAAHAVEAHDFAPEIVEAGWFDMGALPQPMPTLARRMIRDSMVEGPAVLAEVDDDRDLS